MTQLIYTILDEKFEEFKIGFLKCQPVPNGMTKNQWIKEWGKQQFIRAYQIGKRQIAREQAMIDNNIIGV